MHLGPIVRIALLTAVAVVVAACGGGASVSSTPAAPSAAASEAGAIRVEVDLNDQLRMDPETMTVPVGVPVTFVVTNTGAIEHEFYLGDEAEQTEHEGQMEGMDGMMDDEPMGFAVAPGQTKELTTTFTEPGMTIAGCHVAGHYAGGMRAMITIAG